MEQGFVIDEGYGSRTVTRWHRGEPQKSIFGTLKVSKKDALNVATYRCTRCGYLESYA